MGKKFGCHPTLEAPKLLQSAKKLALEVIGVSFHVGNGCKDPMTYHKALRASRQLFDYAQKMGFKFNVVDIGGGFPGDNQTSFEEVPFS